jgi:hypothetical protein
MTKTDFEGTDLEMMIMIKGYNETARKASMLTILYGQ